MNWYIEVLKKYVVFSGRARRKEYWYFFLFNILISFVLAFIDGATGMLDATTGMGTIGGIYSLAVFLPSIAVAVRRLHDTGRTGWWLAIILLPIIGALILLVFSLFDSQEGDNEYGENPKAGL